MAVDLRVVGHAGDVGARRVEPGRGGLADDSRHRDGREHAGRLGDVGLADVAALGPGICRQLLLVQRLQRVQRFLRGEARARRCVALQPGEVVELGRAAPLLSALDLGDRALRPDGRPGASLGLLAGVQLLADKAHAFRPPDRAPDRALDLEEGDRFEVADRAGPLDDERERRGLDAAGGQARAVVEARQGTRGVEAHEPVRLGPALGGVGEAVVVGEGLGVGEVGPHLLWHERGGPEATDGLLAAGMGPDAPEDALALAVGVAGVHDELHVGAVEQPFQDLVLLGRGDAPPPPLRDHGQLRHRPVAGPLRVVLGEVEVDDVAAAPADEVAAALDIAVATLVGADGVGDAARDGRLLGDDECGHAAPPYSEKETEPAAMSATPR